MLRHTWLLGIAFGMLILGLLCGAFVLVNYVQSGSVPQITYDQLVQSRPSEGSLVTLTGVRYCTKAHFISFYDEQSPGNVLCVPAYSARLQDEPQPGELSLILVIRDKNILGELWSEPGRSEFTGEVFQSLDRMKDKDKNEVEKEYPGIHLGNCRLLIGSVQDPTAKRMGIMIWPAVVLVLGACISFGCWAWLRAAAKDVQRTSTESSSTSQ